MHKYRCVDLAGHFIKDNKKPLGDARRPMLYLGMGWDTEEVWDKNANGGRGKMVSLDLDVSLLPYTKDKTLIEDRVLYYGRLEVTCMKSYGDDREGEDPGDDEMVHIDFACVNENYPDIWTIAVLVTVYQPAGYHWTNVDSAYLRMINGGKAEPMGGNYYVKSAEAVRSYVRLSGNDIKADPDMHNQGAVIGFFFQRSNG